MQNTKMHIEPNDTGLFGLAFAVILWIGSCSLSIVSNIDSLLLLFVHMVQGLAFGGTLIAALCTASPTFKSKFETTVKRIFKK